MKERLWKFISNIDDTIVSLKVLKILDSVSFILSIYYTPFCIPKNKLE